MQRALIGFGTALGSYLAQRLEFSDHYTYKQALSGIKPCDEAIFVCPSGKLLGGRSLAPHGYGLAAQLKKSAGRIVVLSSVEVYPAKGVPFDEYSLPFGSHHKAWLETFEQEILTKGPEASILRLPEIFGLAGVKPAFKCDPSKVNRVAIHQWYPVRRLVQDIALAQTSKTTIVNLVSEPLPMAAVLKHFFPGQIGKVTTPAPYSRIRTRFAELFSGSGSYIMSASDVLEEIGLALRAAEKVHPDYRAAGAIPSLTSVLAAV